MYKWGSLFLVGVFYSAWGTLALAAPIIPGSFSAIWNAADAGDADYQISIKTDSSSVNYSVYWEEVGNASNNGTSTATTTILTIDVPSLGQYRLDITGMTHLIAGGARPDTSEISEILQWGNTTWSSMQGSFRGLTALTISAADAPDLSQVTDMSNMFRATPLQGPIADWDVSNVRSFSAMFQDSDFNQPLNTWDTSAALNMTAMFYQNTEFNQPLSNWNVSTVNNFAEMFSEATSFNQDISTWDITGISTPDTGGLGDIFYNTNLSATNYSAILTGWSGLPNLPLGTALGVIGRQVAPTNYFSTAQTARNLLTSTKGWTVTDGGPVTAYAFTYSAGTRATLIGTGSQTVLGGANGTAVEVIPDSGYRFIKWSDERTDNPRTDTAAANNITVTAVVEADAFVADGRSSTGTRVGDRQKNSTSTDVDTLLASVEQLVADMQASDSELKNLPLVEKKKLLTLLQSIVLYLMTLLVDLE